MSKTKLFFNVIVILTLVLVSLGNTSMVAQAGNNKYEPKADPRLLQMAADHPNDTFKVIVQKECEEQGCES